MRGSAPTPLRWPVAVVAAAVLAASSGPTAAAPTLEWQHLYDGGSQQGDTGLKALTDPAGHLVVAGEVTDGAGNGNLLVRKLDRVTGDPLWSRSVLGTSDNRLAVGGMVWDGGGDLLIGGTRLGCYG